MSYSDFIACPNCSRNMEIITSSDCGYPDSEGKCLCCGFKFYTSSEYMTLDELNQERMNYNEAMAYEYDEEDSLFLLTELPKQDTALVDTITVNTNPVEESDDPLA